MLHKLLSTPKQMSQIIRTLPNNKAPGNDEITGQMLKNIPKKAVVQLTHIINNVVIHQHFPASWKHAITVPILKAGKDPNNPSSYRPIALLSLLGKVAERAILNKIHDLGLTDALPDEQFGFRGGIVLLSS